MMSDDNEDTQHGDPMMMSIVGVKGLMNPCGENNCFLNSAVQVWKFSYLLVLMYISSSSSSSSSSSNSSSSSSSSTYIFWSHQKIPILLRAIFAQF